jgi:hypothetical protein
MPDSHDNLPESEALKKILAIESSRPDGFGASVKCCYLPASADPCSYGLRVAQCVDCQHLVISSGAAVALLDQLDAQLSAVYRRKRNHG